MPNLTREKIEKAYNKAYNILNLGHWDAYVDWNREAPEDTMALTEFFTGRHKAITYFEKDILQREVEEVNDTIFHEMVHFLNFPVLEGFRETFSSNKQIVEQYKYLNYHNECTTDSLARVLSENINLFDEE